MPGTRNARLTTRPMPTMLATAVRRRDTDCRTLTTTGITSTLRVMATSGSPTDSPTPWSDGVRTPTARGGSFLGSATRGHQLILGDGCPITMARGLSWVVALAGRGYRAVILANGMQTTSKALRWL